MSISPLKLRVKELDPELIPPNTKNAHRPEYGGSKIIVIGKPHTGKSTLIASLLYAKKHIIPTAMVMSGTEDSNGFYQQFIPSSFVYNEYNEEKIKDFVKRQKIAKEYCQNPWSALVVDDCTDEPKIFNKPVQHGLFKRGRHFKFLYILSLQYAMDIRPVIRMNVDGVFILREANPKIRKSLWENYAGIISDYSVFCSLMDQLTEDFHAIYIDNTSQKADWESCVYYYKAPIHLLKDFKFGCKDYWAFHEKRYNTEYTNSFM